MLFDWSLPKRFDLTHHYKHHRLIYKLNESRQLKHWRFYQHCIPERSGYGDSEHLVKVPYGISIAFNKKLHEMASFFRRPTYPVWILIGTKANAIRIVAFLLDKGAGWSWWINHFCPGSGAYRLNKLTTLISALSSIKQCPSTVSYRCS